MAYKRSRKSSKKRSRSRKSSKKRSRSRKSSKKRSRSRKPSKKRRSRSRKPSKKRRSRSRKPYFVKIEDSDSKGKKLKAVFYDKERNKIKTTHFGAKGYSDYTKHKDPERKQRYINRHRSRENWKDPTSAGALSLYILWNKKTPEASISDYRRRFKLKKF